MNYSSLAWVFDIALCASRGTRIGSMLQLQTANASSPVMILPPLQKTRTFSILKNSILNLSATHFAKQVGAACFCKIPHLCSTRN